MDNKSKHLEMIQRVIGNMTVLSYVMKVVAVVMVTVFVMGYFAFPESRGFENAACACVFVIHIVFLGLNASCTYQKMRYKKLYNIVRERDEVDFDMDPDFKGDSGAPSFFDGVASEIIYYVVLLVLYFIAMAIASH
ncbi:MAG: hypothetical protein K6F92_04495 [Lachnospiraceae bacterium]|nr:hypothetical protein [Lachnospiraceae bacterium]